jgi:hypothetical protein
MSEEMGEGRGETGESFSALPSPISALFVDAQADAINATITSHRDFTSHLPVPR